MTWKLAGACVAVGLIGVLVGLGLLHLYADHRFIDDIRIDLMRQQQQQRAMPPPVATPEKAQ